MKLVYWLIPHPPTSLAQMVLDISEYLKTSERDLGSTFTFLALDTVGHLLPAVMSGSLLPFTFNNNVKIHTVYEVWIDTAFKLVEKVTL